LATGLAGSGFPLISFFPMQGLWRRSPAVASIELVEDSVLIEISYVDFMSLLESFGEVPSLVEKIRANYQKMRAGNSVDLANLYARERYQKFFGLHKELFNVAKHKDIASFLGIRDDGFHRYQQCLFLVKGFISWSLIEMLNAAFL